DRAAEQPHPQRGRAGRRHRLDHRPGAGAGPGAGRHDHRRRRPGRGRGGRARRSGRPGGRRPARRRSHRGPGGHARCRGEPRHGGHLRRRNPVHGHRRPGPRRRHPPPRGAAGVRVASGAGPPRPGDGLPRAHPGRGPSLDGAGVTTARWHGTHRTGRGWGGTVIRLTRVELRRMTARRMIQLAAVAVAAIVALGLFGTWQHLSEATSDQPEALAAYEQARREWEQHGPAMLEQCLADQEADREQSGDPDIDYGCADMEPRPEHFLMVAQPRDQAAHGLLTGAGFPVLFLAFAIGATATAAEFTHRTMGTWLTFEPRRTRVLGSKLLAAALGTLPLGIGFVVLVVLGTAALYGIFDVGETVPSGLAAGAVTLTSV